MLLDKMSSKFCVMRPLRPYRSVLTVKLHAGSILSLNISFWNLQDINSAIHTKTADLDSDQNQNLRAVWYKIIIWIHDYCFQFDQVQID